MKITRVAFFLIVLVVGIGMLCVLPNAHALSLTLSDGATTLQVDDENFIASLNNPADGFAGVGTVSFTGSIGSFIVVVTAGASKPVIGSAIDPQLHLTNLSITGGAGTLDVSVSDIDFLGNPSITGYTTSVGGVAAGTVDVSTFFGNSNTLFETSGALAPLASFGPGAFSDTSENYDVFNAPYSLTILSQIKHTGPGTTSLDVQLSPIPEPTTLLLLGGGLIGLAGLGRRKFLKNRG